MRRPGPAAISTHRQLLTAKSCDAFILDKDAGVPLVHHAEAMPALQIR
jgi:hypothetical protein